MLTSLERPLSEPERNDLSARLARARRESRTALIKTGAASLTICTALAVATIYASNAPVPVIVLFWSVAAGAFTLWIGMPWRRLMQHQMAALSDALGVSRARDIRVQASRVVTFEEEEDEG